jgi:hypothetical protein
MKVTDAIARIDVLVSSATGERATMLTLSPADFEALKLASAALGHGATCTHCAPAIRFAAKYPLGIATDSERNWDSMYPGADSSQPPAAELCPVCSGPLTPEAWCARCADPSIPPDTYGNADHDRAVCDCEACENERRAAATHGDFEHTQIQTFEVKPNARYKPCGLQIWDRDTDTWSSCRLLTGHAGRCRSR